jgi:hypothetical protein
MANGIEIAPTLVADDAPPYREPVPPAQEAPMQAAPQDLSGVPDAQANTHGQMVPVAEASHNQAPVQNQQAEQPQQPQQPQQRTQQEIDRFNQTFKPKGAEPPAFGQFGQQIVGLFTQHQQQGTDPKAFATEFFGQDWGPDVVKQMRGWVDAQNAAILCEFLLPNAGWETTRAQEWLVRVWKEFGRIEKAAKAQAAAAPVPSAIAGDG